MSQFTLKLIDPTQVPTPPAGYFSVFVDINDNIAKIKLANGEVHPMGSSEVAVVDPIDVDTPSTGFCTLFTDINDGKLKMKKDDGFTYPIDQDRTKVDSPIDVEVPPAGYGKIFIDPADNIAKIKLSDGLIYGINGLGMGIIEIPVTFFNSGSDYYARFGAINVIKGDIADFVITPAITPTSSDTLVCSKEIISCKANVYLQGITQTGSNRVFASLFGGARSTGGGISFPINFNNPRMSHPLDLGYVAPSDAITMTMNFSGSNPLTNNGSKLIIQYQRQ